MDYAPYHKYLFPRHHRERMYDGVDVQQDATPCHDGSSRSGYVTHRNYGNMQSYVTVGNVMYSSRIGQVFDQQSASVGQDNYWIKRSDTVLQGIATTPADSGMSEFPYSITVILIWRDQSGAQYQATVGNIAVYEYGAGSGFSAMRITSGGSSHYIAGSGLSTLDDSVHARSYISDKNSGNAFVYEDCIDKTNASYNSAVDPDNPGSTGINISSSYICAISRVVIHRKALSPSEVAMINAGLM